MQGRRDRLVSTLNARPPEQLDKWLTRIETELAQYQRENPGRKVAPYAVNLIVNKANQRLDGDLEVVLSHKAPIVITSLSAPTKLVPRVHEYGGIVFHDVIKVRHAEKALEAGVDGLIAVCAGAGGHAGTLNPSHWSMNCGASIKVRWCSRAPSPTVRASRGGGDGMRSCVSGHALHCNQGIDGGGALQANDRRVRLGDIVYTPFFGVHGSYLAGSIRNAGLDPDNLPANEALGLYRSREERPKTWTEIWGAGHGVGNIDDSPTVAQLVDRLEAAYFAARRRIASGVA